MGDIGKALFVGLVAFSIWGGNSGHGAPAPEPARVENHAKKHWYSWMPFVGDDKPARVSVPSGDPITAASNEYGVPSWYLYTTWQVESAGMTTGEGASARWFRAADLAKQGSACAVNKGVAWCQHQWQALNVICNQERSDGSRVCDPNTVKTSWAFAMGQMQVLPTNIVKVDGGTTEWTKNAADFDGDGTANPLVLADAMAMSAKISRHFHDGDGSADDLQGWLQTADRYFGKATPERRAKILEHAEEWCETHECGSYREEIASR